MNLSAESGDDGAFFMTTTDSFRLAWILAGIMTWVGSPDAAKIPDVRLPHRVRSGIERGELMSFAAGQSIEAAHRSIHHIAGEPLLPLLP